MSFEAKYPGRCSVCERRVDVGELINYDRESKTVTHEHCTPAKKKIESRSGGMGYRGRTAEADDSRPRKSPLARSYANVTVGGNGPKIVAMAFGVTNAEQMGEALTNKNFFSGSDEQEAIWDAMLRDSTHMMVNACAGSGKTSTAQQGILRMMRDLDASAKACTYHSLGYSICRKNFPALNLTRPNKYKLRNIIDELERPLSVDEDNWYNVQHAIADVVKFAKIHLLDGTDRNRLEELVDFFGVALDEKNEDIVYELVPRVIRACLDRTSEVDFPDMIFFPAMMDLRGDVYDLLISDENQDLSQDQRKLFQLACPSGRIMAIGDVWQNLYSWRGSTDSMEQLREVLAATPRGVKDYPLTMTRRCPKSHVRLAQAISGEEVIQAMPDAPEGIIKVMGESEAISSMRAGDLVLCRVNRYLIPAAYDLIRRGIKAVVRGREIGTGLETLIKKLTKDDPQGSTSYLLKQLRVWERAELERLHALGDRAEGRIQSVQDNAETIIALTEGMATIPEVLTRINDIFKDFEDDGRPVHAVTLGTVHKLKGLQGNHVFILKPELMPHPMSGPNFFKGELCGIYVAVTRAKWDKDGTPGELIFCGSVPEPIRAAYDEMFGAKYDDEDRFSADGSFPPSDADESEGRDDDDSRPRLDYDDGDEEVREDARYVN